MEKDTGNIVILSTKTNKHSDRNGQKIKALSLLPKQSEADLARIQDEILALEYGNVLLEMRKAANLTQAALAEKVGKDQATISRLEKGNGGHLLNLKTLHQIAEACGCSKLRIVPERDFPSGEGNNENGGINGINLKAINSRK